jgi:hypothetical protein
LAIGCPAITRIAALGDTADGMIALFNLIAGDVEEAVKRAQVGSNCKS